MPLGSDIHMVGVCGVGMAGVARLLAARNYNVSGCDSSLNELADGLRSSGVAVYKGHSEMHVDALSDNATLIVTPAVSPDEPELAAARARGLPVCFRGEVLASLISESFGIAICGTHGKTTTSCFAARLFQELGSDPGWCIGGYTAELGGVASPGDNQLLIVEADESDGTLQYYHPELTVVNNIDLDHLEHFDGEESLIECFQDVVGQTGRGVCVCRDDKRAYNVVTRSGKKFLDFGFDEDATLRAADVVVQEGASSFVVFFKGLKYGRVELEVGGCHNILNALGAAAAALMYDFKVEDVLNMLPAACTQLPGRRFEELKSVDGVRFVADYAHHPAELKGALEMAAACTPKRLVAVFQPHRYSRTCALGDQFPAAFDKVDELILLPVYAASESLIEGGDICDLYAHFRQQLPDLKVSLASDLNQCWFYLKHSLKSGDLVLIAGAGDVINLRDALNDGFGSDKQGDFEREIAVIDGACLSCYRSLSSCSAFPTAGSSRYWIEVENCLAIQAVVNLCRNHEIEWRVAGGGMNSWFSDCGFDGCLIRFKPGRMNELQVKDVEVEAECGLRGPQLLDMLEQHGLAGLEFLEGVPGTLGGWLAMNAGAHGGEICDCVRKIDCIGYDGAIKSVSVDECGFGYRQCDLLKNAVALRCTLGLERGDRESIKRQRRIFGAKRVNLQGVRTAGSVFRNPLPESAGRLLDQAGCKGMRVGGAYVTAFHANIVAVDKEGTASDVVALIKKMRNRVFFKSRIDLKPEICGIRV